MLQIASPRVVTGVDDAPVPATLDVAQGRIIAVHDGVLPTAWQTDDVLVPGFVDTHCHGGAGADFTDEDPGRVAEAIALHRRHGSTTLFASTVTASMDEVAAQVQRLRPLVEAGELAGIHLEGPFLSAARKGAHQESLLCDPTPERVARLLEVAGGSVRMVTLAPERDHGMAAVEALAAAGVVAAFGHSDADAAITREAVDHGARVATHLFNAMRGVHHREPGPVPPLLSDERVVVELICDGVHLHPEVVRMAVAAAGPQRVALVTDAMSATGCADGDYLLGALPVQVRGGTARLVSADGAPGAIAGSTLTMDRAFAFAVQVGCSLVEASRMASTTPASAHGLAEVGQLVPGRMADLCRVRDDGSLVGVMRRGEWVHQAAHDGLEDRA